MLDMKTLETRHAPVRYLEGGKGQPLVYLHGAGGVTADDPFLEALAERLHVYAPFLPGYGETEDCPELRDMLDYTLHTWDVVEGLGPEGPDARRPLHGRHDRRRNGGAGARTTSAGWR